MNLTFKCGECGSTMTLDFKSLQNRFNRPSFSIRCQACDARLNDNVAYELLGFIRTYQQYETKWEFEWKLSDPKVQQT